MWYHLSEGNANVLLSYKGKNDRFVGKALRISKKYKDLYKSVEFYKNIVNTFIGNEYLVEMEVIDIDGDEITQISAAMDGKNYFVRNGILLTNLILNDSITVEIKPKWGTKYTENGKCRYCLHQNLKLKEQKIKEKSKFCPLDLYSEKNNLMNKAFDQLFVNPQNNLRIFDKGISKNVSEYKFLQQQIIDVLIESRILSKLRDAQIAFDPFGVDSMCEIFEKYNYNDLDLNEPCITPFTGEVNSIDSSKEYLHSYLTAMTLRDCSILIVFDKTKTLIKVIDLDRKPFSKLEFYVRQHRQLTHEFLC